MSHYTAALLFGFMAGILGIITYVFDDLYTTFEVYAVIMLVLIIIVGIKLDGR